MHVASKLAAWFTRPPNMRLARCEYTYHSGGSGRQHVCLRVDPFRDVADVL